MIFGVNYRMPQRQTVSANTPAVTSHLLHALKVPVTATTVRDTLEQHPDYPSLLSISDSLRKWKVDNVAIEVSPEHLDELPMPFIAHSRDGGGRFMLVTSVNGAIEYKDERGSRFRISRDGFVKEWSGVALVAEKTATSGEEGYREKIKKERHNEMVIPYILMCCIASVVLHFFFTPDFGIYGVLVAATLLMGSVVSALLLWFDIDKANPVLKQFCSGGRQTNCEAVLQSKQARILNWISWSEIGFFYFAGSFLILITAPAAGVFGVLAWLNLLVLPYTVFSVYYQWRVVRQWCKLCLLIQGLLVVQLLLNYFGYWKSLPQATPTATQVVALFASFLLPVFFWAATKRVYLSAQQGRRDKKELYRLKYNKEIFTALLQKQKKITKSTEGLGIVLGNPEAEHTIVKVCNPYCGPCAKAHWVIDEILDEKPNVKVQIIFTASNDDNDIKAAPVRHLMALYGKNDPSVVKEALDSWYNVEKKDFEIFAAKYPLNGEVKMQGKKLELMDEWCKAIGISFTPTIFINGYQLPQQYKIGDVKYLI